MSCYCAQMSEKEMLDKVMNLKEMVSNGHS